MDVQLTVIGCSPAWPNPGSANSGYLVESGGRRLLLDCGPGVLSRLRQDDLLPVDAIAITHLHLDHWGDLVPWVWLTHGVPGMDDRPELLLPPGGLDDLAAFGGRFAYANMFEDAFAARKYEARAPFDAAGYRITAIPVDHFGMVAFGFRVEDGDGAVLAFSGDSSPCPELGELADGASLFLCEATLATGDDDTTPRGHLSAEEALAVGNGRTLLTHRPAELAAPRGAECAFDGLSVAV